MNAQGKKVPSRHLNRLVILAVLVSVTGGCGSIRRIKIAKTRSTMDCLGVALKSYERDTGSFEAKLENGDQMPTGILDVPSKRAKLVRILTGKKADGTVDSQLREDSRWNGPYLEPKAAELRDGQLADAWGRPFMIRLKTSTYDARMRYKPESFEIYSFGPNGKDEHGLGDDVNNWD
jgi:uncharacterized protein YceK